MIQIAFLSLHHSCTLVAPLFLEHYSLCTFRTNLLQSGCSHFCGQEVCRKLARQLKIFL
jgi:hypothetical protein